MGESENPKIRVAQTIVIPMFLQKTGAHFVKLVKILFITKMSKIESTKFLRVKSA